MNFGVLDTKIIELSPWWFRLSGAGPLWRPLLFYEKIFVAKSKPRIIVYIDGFNFHYEQLKNSPYKWLQLPYSFDLWRRETEVFVTYPLEIE